jgi:site-specific DNA recombinase
MPSTNGHGSQPEQVALYLRVSSEEQREAGTIQTQTEVVRAYAERMSFEIVETYADEGISGTIPLHERPAGRRLLEDAKEGEFAAVLIYRLDRLGRSLFAIVDAHDRLDKLGVGLISASEQIDTTTPSGRLHFQVLASVAEFEKASIVQRTKDGLHRKYREGRYMGTIPFGYRTDGAGRLEIDTVEAVFVKEMFERIADGGTLYSVAKWLNDLGVEPPSSKYATKDRLPARLWRAPTVRVILRNTTYSGTHTIKLGNGEVVEQLTPTIVTTELQRRALGRLEENRRYSGGKKTRNYLLSGLIQCEVCGSSCSGRSITARGKKYPYYRCCDDNALRPHRAPRGHSPNVRADWLEGIVWADVRQFLADPGATLARVREQQESGEATAELEERRADLTKRLATAQEDRVRLLDAFTKGMLDESDLEVALPDVKNRIENLRMLIASVEDQLAAAREHAELAENTEAWLMMLRDRVEEIEEDTPDAYATRRELVKLLVEKIVAGRDENGSVRVQITYRFGPPETPEKVEEFVSGVGVYSGVHNALPHHLGKRYIRWRRC